MKKTRLSGDYKAPPRAPRIIVPGVGVAQVVLHHWFQVEKYLWEVVGDRMQMVVSVTYFRLWLPATKQFWSYQAGAKNLVPHDAVVVYG